MRISFHEWVDPASVRQVTSALADNEVQVWLATVPAMDVDMLPFFCALSSGEEARAKRFRVDGSRCQFVFGRALLRQLLGACLNVDPPRVVIGSAARGKPCLDRNLAERDLRFNLSHSHSQVAIALACGVEVGVDIEWMDRSVDWRLVAERIFSSGELSELRSLPESQQREAFFNGWTRKEAYLKATGEGLINEISAVEVTLAPGTKPELLGFPPGSGDPVRWGIRDIPLSSGYAGALVFGDGDCDGQRGYSSGTPDCTFDARKSI